MSGVKQKGGDSMKCCPYCGGFMCYDRHEDTLYCDTCCYMIRSIAGGRYIKDFSEMDPDFLSELQTSES